jgi:hypothetical protein
MHRKTSHHDHEKVHHDHEECTHVPVRKQDAIHVQMSINSIQLQCGRLLPNRAVEVQADTRVRYLT